MAKEKTKKRTELEAKATELGIAFTEHVDDNMLKLAIAGTEAPGKLEKAKEATTKAKEGETKAKEGETKAKGELKDATDLNDDLSAQVDKNEAEKSSGKLSVESGGKQYLASAKKVNFKMPKETASQEYLVADLVEKHPEVLAAMIKIKSPIFQLVKD